MYKEIDMSLSTLALLTGEPTLMLLALALPVMF